MNPCVDEYDVRRVLIGRLQAAGGPEAFAKSYGFNELYILEAARGQTILSAKLLSVLGFERVTRYVRSSVASRVSTATTRERDDGMDRRTV